MKSLKRPRENSARMPGNSTSPTPRGFEGNSNSPYGPGAWGQSDPMDRNQELPLLRIHVLSAKGLPRSSGAVGMPDPYVVVKFNQEKVGETKVDHKTRRPEWKEHFLIRSDLAEPDPPPEDDDASNADDDEPYNATS
ncbi:unnamed protein product, partial [Sphacelaria rigidula]